jgi:CheY-like chemotaxis protein/HPt (histidine-containing phosphotransfer) domain-containing protein
MTACRILHVDDEPDIRRIVELALAGDSAFVLRSCHSGEEAIAVAAEWCPHLILCDVMMPVLDGPATLARLRADARTAGIPLIFMTARGQEPEHFQSLGAAGVIAKPFGAKRLREALRSHIPEIADSATEPSEIPASKFAVQRSAFLERLSSDAEELTRLRTKHSDGSGLCARLDELLAFAHKLAGAAGFFGFEEVRQLATDLENFLLRYTSGEGDVAGLEAKAEALLFCLQRHCGTAGSRQQIETRAQRRRSS